MTLFCSKTPEMKTTVKKFSDLQDSERALWQSFVDAQPVWSSPYFQPAFTEDVACVRDDVRVAIVSAGDEVIGFFPFQQQGKAAVPVSGQLSDAHAVITHDGRPVNWTELMKSCGLSTWKFHYLVDHQCPAEECSASLTPAAIMDVSGGFEKYVSRLKSKNVIKQTDRKQRKIDREIGSVRFEWDCRDEKVFDQLIQWKSEQYRRSDIADVFQFDWTTALLKRLWARNDDQLQGLLSVLYSDDRPLAMHFGIRSGKVLHQWFPAYDPDPELQPFSPGAVHLIEEARSAIDHGVERIDLGKACAYKNRIATDYVDMAEGFLDLNPISRMLRGSYQNTYEWLRDSRLKSVVRIPGRMIRRMVENRQFQ